MQISGLELARRFYEDAIAPIVTRVLGPDVEFAAALIGPGSEVLGLDSERSHDHDWGPRCQLFLTGAALERRHAVQQELTAGLPSDFAGFPTGSTASDGNDDRGAAGGPGVLSHRVEVLDLERWWRNWSGQAPGEVRSPAGWLALPTQRLAELTEGAVFHDGTGRLTAARASLAWYPDDVWRYVLACSWRRIAEEQPFVGRCAEAGDDLGSALLAGRLARDVMRLWLLLQRRYPPYSKWLGTRFADLPAAADVGRDLWTAVTAVGFPERERALMRALTATIERQNAAGLSTPTGAEPHLFYTRPYLVVDADAAAAALMDAISAPELRGRPARAAIDVVTDNVAVTGEIPATRSIVETLLSPR